MSDNDYDDEPIDCSEGQNRRYGSYHEELKTVEDKNDTHRLRAI